MSIIISLQFYVMYCTNSKSFFFVVLVLGEGATVEGECAYNPNLSIQPLMRNWTEGAATRRDRFDYDNGRGRGNVKVSHCVLSFLNVL